LCTEAQKSDGKGRRGPQKDPRLNSSSKGEEREKGKKKIIRQQIRVLLRQSQTSSESVHKDPGGGVAVHIPNVDPSEARLKSELGLERKRIWIVVGDHLAGGSRSKERLEGWRGKTKRESVSPRQSEMFGKEGGAIHTVLEQVSQSLVKPPVPRNLLVAGSRVSAPCLTISLNMIWPSVLPPSSLTKTTLALRAGEDEDEDRRRRSTRAVAPDLEM
jgi:hypothetical protein